MKTPAAVLVETGKPLVLTELEMPLLQPGQVLVEIAVSGVCHTQLLECRGHRGADRFLPHCLGHEGAGWVREIGPGVKKATAGNPVILSWMRGSGAEVPGTAYGWNGQKVNAGGITTFSRYSVISENRLTVIPSDLPMAQAALLGCAVPTGLGAIFNTALPKPGQSLVVFGTGGIGLCAVAGAAIAGCAPVIAVDIRKEKLETARQMGATHVVNAAEGDPLEKIKALCAGGADFAVEASGRPEVMRQALACVRQRGGTAVVIGNAHHGQKLEIDPWELNLGKRLLGTWGGDNAPDEDFPRYVKLVLSGRLKLDPLVSRNYPLSQANQALDDLESGRTLRPLLEMNDGVR